MSFDVHLDPFGNYAKSLGIEDAGTRTQGPRLKRSNQRCFVVLATATVSPQIADIPQFRALPCIYVSPFFPFPFRRVLSQICHNRSYGKVACGVESVTTPPSER